jgi:dTDP-4-amino-4,6-dideoxygalactose transaminase
MTVPFQDLTRLHASIESELSGAVSRVVSNSGFVGGNEVKAFEEAFAEAHGASGAASCGSGTDALSLTLRAVGVRSGDEVIIPSMTFVATAEAVVHAGATPVIADVDKDTLLLSSDEVDRLRTDQTRAVIPVHLYGHVVPFAEIKRWRNSGLAVIEDAAQAHLATENGQAVGSAGNAACFSFYPGKNLGAWGDGGAVISNDSDLLSEIRRLRDHGRDSKYLHTVIGWCSRLDGLQAAVLATKLRHLPGWTEARRRVATRYRDQIEDLLVPWEDGAVHHLIVVSVAGGVEQRDRVRERLSLRGIGTGVHYPVPLSSQPSLERWSRPCPRSEDAGDSVLSLPMDPLMSDREVDEVCEALHDALT